MSEIAPLSFTEFSKLWMLKFIFRVTPQVSRRQVDIQAQAASMVQKRADMAVKNLEFGSIVLDQPHPLDRLPII